MVKVIQSREVKTLKEWRNERSLTVDELAQRADLDRGTLCKLLYTPMKRGPTTETAHALARALKVDPDQINWKVERSSRRSELEGLPPMPQQKDGEVTAEQLKIAQEWLDAGISMGKVSQAVGTTRYLLTKYLKDRAES